MTQDNPLIVELALTSQRLEALLQDRSEDELRRRPAPDEWSAKEIVGHLRDAGEIFGGRVTRVTTEEHPYLAAWNEQEYARAGNYMAAASAALVPAFRAQRELALASLTGLTPAGWQRTALHEETGEMTLAQLAIDVAYHEAMHLRDLTRLLGAVPAGV